MKRIFADTSFYIAATSPKDEAHGTAAKWMLGHADMVVTTDFVVVELANFFSRSTERGTFAALHHYLAADSQVEIVPASRELVERGLQLYLNRDDKDWSLTDCISFVVMQDHGITEALTADRHFEQAGFVPLLA
jgi:hypothetical protein